MPLLQQSIMSIIPDSAAHATRRNEKMDRRMEDAVLLCIG